MQALLATVALRLRTRLFAAQLVHRMLQVAERRCAVDPLELVPTRAMDRSTLEEHEGGHSGGIPRGQLAAPRNKMVDHLQEFIEVGYKISIGAVEALKPSGVWLLHAVLRVYGSVEDPLLPGARLLENHQAHLVGALRASLAPATSAAGPVLAIAGGQLATTFLESGLAGSDSKVMRRLLELLTSPLSSGSGLKAAGGAYAEWVGIVHALALLQAHAQCAVIAHQGGNELILDEVSEAHRPHRPLLRSLWFALLQDHAVLSTQPPPVLHAYPSALLATSSQLSHAQQQAQTQAPPLAATDGQDGSQVTDAKEAAPPQPSTAATILAAKLQEGPGSVNEISEEGGQIGGGDGGGDPDHNAQPSAAGMRLYRGFRSTAIASAQAGGGGGGDGTEGSAIMSSQVVRRVRPAYAAAAPVALRALNLGYFPIARIVADARDSPHREERSAYFQYCVLVDVGLLMLPQATHSLAHCVEVCLAERGSKEVGDIAASEAALESCVAGLHGLMSADHLTKGLVEASSLLQALHELEALVHHTLAPMQWAALTKGAKGWAPPMASLTATLSSFLKELAQSTPPTLLTTDPSPAPTNSTNSTSDTHQHPIATTTTAFRDSTSSSGTALCRAFVECLLAAASITTPFSLAPTNQPHSAPTQGTHHSTHHSSNGHDEARMHSSANGVSSSGSNSNSDSLAARCASGSVVAAPMPLVGGPAQPAASSHSAGLISSSNAALEGALVALLVAAQALVRRADQQQQQQGQCGADCLTELLPPLLQLSVRLLATAPPGVQLQAAHRFFDTHMLHALTLADRLAAPASSANCNGSSSTKTAENTTNNTNSNCAAASSELQAAAEGALLRVMRGLHACVRDVAHSHARFGCGASPTPDAADGHSAGHSAGHTVGVGAASPSDGGEGHAGGDEDSSSKAGVTQQSAAAAQQCAHLQQLRSRAPVLLSAALTACTHLACASTPAATSTPQGSDGGKGGAHALRAYLLGVMRDALCVRSMHSVRSMAQRGGDGGGAPTAVADAAADVVDCIQAKAAEGVRLVLQEGAVAGAAPGKVQWAQQVLDALGPLVSEVAHARMSANVSAQAECQQDTESSTSQQQQQQASSVTQKHMLLPLSQGSVSVVSECVKALVAAASFVGAAQGEAGQDAVMQVLLPLLVLAAAPPSPAHPTLALKELAVKLITSLPGSPIGAPFKSALAGLPPALKQRLQGALKEPEAGLVVDARGGVRMASARSMAPGSAASAARPTIQLKTTFAIPK